MSYMDDAKVVEQLTQFKGIGEWTANIFLIFSLGRIDAFPRNDLALRRAVARAYDVDVEDEDTFDLIVTRWQPYRTVACWYMWRSLGIQSI